MNTFTTPARSFTMIAPDGRRHPWVILTRPDGTDMACHLDDAIGAMLSGRWRPGALHEVTDAMRAVAEDAA